MTENQQTAGGRIMRARFLVLLFGLIVLAGGEAVAKDQDDLWDLSAYRLPNGELDLGKLQQDYKKKNTKQTSATRQSRDATIHTRRPSTTTPAPASVENRGAPPPPPPSSSLIFVLRKSFADIGLFSDPISNKDADGAAFSWTDDKIARNTTWSANATAAVAYNYFVEDIRNPFIGLTVAPYVNLNRVINSNNQSHNTDEKTFGVSGEIGAKSILFPHNSDYLRGSGAAVQDDILGTNIAHGAIEWLPTYFWNAGTVPGTYLNYNFMPEVEAQYDRTNASDKTLLFSGRREALRLGPEARLWFKVVAPGTALAALLDRLYGTVTFHWWSELYSRRSDTWLDASVHYNLDESGNVALAFNYQHGRTEDTGTQTNLYQIVLTAKTCADLFSGKSC